MNAAMQVIGDLSADEAHLLRAIRAKVIGIVREIRGMDDQESERRVAREIELYVSPMREASEEFATKMARHIALEVRRLRAH